MRLLPPRPLAMLGLLLGMASTCFAQVPPFPQTLNDHTVVGRLGSGTGSGPAQAIPFTSLSAVGGFLLGPTPPTVAGDLATWTNTLGTSLQDAGSGTVNGAYTWSGAQTFSGTVSGAGITSLFASPPAIGGTAAAGGAFTTLSASSTVSGTGFSTYLASPPAIGGSAAAAGSFTTLSASSTVSGTGFSTYLASPPAIGGSAAAAGSFTTLSASSTVSGTGFSTYLASPPAIGGTAPGTGKFTTVTDTGLAAQGVTCNSSAGLLSTSTTYCAGATPARTQSTVNAPSGTANTSGVMAGLAGTITPATTGSVMLTISGYSSNSVSGDGCVVVLREGTGSAPSNGGGLVGTAIGNVNGQQMTSSAANASTAFSLTGYVTGLAAGTPVWLDLQFWALTGGTCSLHNLTIVAIEE